MRRTSRIIGTVVGATMGLLLGLRRAAAARRRRDEVRRNLARRRSRPPAPADYRLSVVVPAYREERIGDTVRRLRAELAAVDGDGGLEIVVVDDGSGDATPDRAGEAGADQVLRQPVNRGKGAAVRAGMLAARGSVVAFTDADLAYSPDQIANLLAAVEEGWDVVVGSRHHDDTTTLVRAGLVRELGHRVIGLATRSVLVGDHRDTQCGLKALRGDVARELFSRTRIDGFAFDVELFHLVERDGRSLTEVPVQVENSARSTVRVGRDALRLLWDLARIRRWARQDVYRSPASAGASGPCACGGRCACTGGEQASVGETARAATYGADDPATAGVASPAGETDGAAGPVAGVEVEAGLQPVP